MARPIDEPFSEDDVIVGVTVAREDLRQLLVAARICQMDAEAHGRTSARLSLAIERIAATATGVEWQPPKSG
jgi:hypothetical protein